MHNIGKILCEASVAASYDRYRNPLIWLFLREPEWHIDIIIDNNAGNYTQSDWELCIYLLFQHIDVVFDEKSVLWVRYL